MNSYEITYLIIPSLTAKEAEDYHKKIKEAIEKTGGVLGKEQIPTRRELAYPVEKNTEGYLASIDFDINKEKVVQVKEKIKEEKDVLRYLLIEKQSLKKLEERRPPRKKKSLKPEKARLKEIDEKIDEIL